jgi:NAD(P)-dependent dehydrogenase (short-subunit alcohol dehydrogenase family)
MAETSGGAIVNVSSCWGGKAPGPNHALYCMTKAAIASLTQCMGMDHGAWLDRYGSESGIH